MGRAKRNARGAEVSAERHSERVNVDDAVAFVSLGDICGGKTERWIKEGKYAVNRTRSSCRHFTDDQARFHLFALAHFCGNSICQPVLPRLSTCSADRSYAVEWSCGDGTLHRRQRRLMANCDFNALTENVEE